MTSKGMSSAIRIIVTIIVLLVVALALLVAVTGSVGDLTSKTKEVVNKILGGSKDNEGSTFDNGEINNLINDIKNN